MIARGYILRTESTLVIIMTFFNLIFSLGTNGFFHLAIVHGICYFLYFLYTVYFMATTAGIK